MSRLFLYCLKILIIFIYLHTFEFEKMTNCHYPFKLFNFALLIALCFQYIIFILLSTYICCCLRNDLWDEINLLSSYKFTLALFKIG